MQYTRHFQIPKSIHNFGINQIQDQTSKRNNNNNINKNADQTINISEYINSAESCSNYDNKGHSKAESITNSPLKSVRSPSVLNS
jgi:hypothetical protein